MTVHANGIEMFAWIDILKLVKTVGRNVVEI